MPIGHTCAQLLPPSPPQHTSLLLGKEVALAALGHAGRCPSGREQSKRREEGAGRDGYGVCVRRACEPGKCGVVVEGGG